MKAEAEQDLKESLSKTETALLSPLVSGELESWAKSAQQATAELAGHLHRYIPLVLHAQYAEIAKTDPDLLTRVEQMVKEDEALLAEMERFRGDLANLLERVPLVKKDEGKTDEHRLRIEEQGTALVQRVKKQQATASTWLNEAIYRDRGVGD